jgi:hypothetical protein
MKGIERDVGGAGFEDGEEGDEGLEAVMEADGDQRASADVMVRDEDAGELIGAAIEIEIREGALLSSEGSGERRAADLRFKEVMKAAVRGERGRRAEQREQQLLPLLFRHQR